MNTQDYFVLKALTGWREVELSDTPPPPAPAGALTALEDVLQHLDAINTVTLDVFDTLLRRDVEPADHLKRPAMQQLALQLSRAGITVGIEALLAFRDEAEAQARQAALTRGGDAECTLSELFDRLYELIDSRYSCRLESLLPVKRLVSFEVRVEAQRLEPMPGALALLQTLKSRGLDIILLSDTYLETRHVRSFLDQHGLGECINDLYVSSDTRRAKGSGNLFRWLVEQARVDPATTLHVGDHPVSDLQRPQQFGIAARLLHIPAEKRRRTRLSQSLKLANRFGDPGKLWETISTPATAVAEASPYRVGYRRLGPIFTLFALDLLLQALKTEYREVYFLARDAWLPQQLYTRLRARLQLAGLLPTPAGRYLYLSRASCCNAGLTGEQGELQALAQQVDPQGDVWPLIEALGLDREDYEPLMAEILGNAEGPDSSNGDSHQYLFQQPTFMQQLHNDLERHRQYLRRYLAQQGFLVPGRILVADIGWNGSIFATLERLFAHSTDFPTIDVRLFGREYGRQCEQIQLQSGFACDARRQNPVEQLINESRELFETLSSTAEGSVLGYDETQGMVTPRLADTALEADDIRLIREVQDGILAYCDDFIRVFNRFHPLPEALHYDAVVQATSLIAGTHPTEQAMLGDLKIDLALGIEERVRLRDYLGFSARNDAAPPPHRQIPVQIGLMSTTGADNGGTQSLFEAIQRMVQRLRQERHLIVYGVGTVASLIAPLLIDNIDYFVDGNKSLHGQRFLDREIRSPEVLHGEREHSVFVTVINRKTVIGKRLAGCSLPVFFIDDFL